MGEISAKSVKDLRDKTGVGMMDCKRAIKDADGDVEKAIELLRERGLAKAGKRGGRATSEGAVSIAIDGSVAAIVEVGCETDFVARTDLFVEFGRQLAEMAAKDASIDGPDSLLKASIDGETVADKVNAAIGRLGENIVVKRVTRLDAGASGVAGGYVHAGGNLGVVVTLATQGSGTELETLAKDLAMHVAAADPSPIAVDRSGVDSALLDSERSIYRNQAIQSGKPEAVVEKIVDGRINKYLSEICLVEQPFVKDPDQTIGDLLKQAGDVKVAAFERFKLGQTGDEDDGEATE